MRGLLLKTLRFLYRWPVRALFFLFNSEIIHEVLTKMGERLGNGRLLKSLTGKLLRVDNSTIAQDLFNIQFRNPVGLAAGFDYEARLTQFLPSLGFGFESVGTITNSPYEGNPKPRLGRLIKSRSLLVNKGFKNLGIDEFINRHRNSHFEIPIGVSMGKTNGQQNMSQVDAINDIVSAFKKVIESKIPMSYLELNISCPNLFGNVEFYTPSHLKELLTAVCGLKLQKPLFIKMPIEKSDEETLAMMEAIVTFPVSAVIFGNLQKNRKDPAVCPEEAFKYEKGNLSGKPTERRSNELIKLVYKKYGSKIKIIGCGGVFSAEDAYKKIKLGASLVQLITGLIYVGPQLVSEINHGLIELLSRDGYKNIREAVGADVD
ncbi:MAG: quinone-dependent dihydroorotate dehydrogenase [Candidatus Vogelbacteria bacterium]|nr:quinone-dependent dihydroorotate dehydrogenase [Candidatus Vogelbacteria bacterium]